MNYRLKRKLSVYAILFLVVGVFVYWNYDLFIKKKPTCFDGIKNGEEEGVDCGGKCEKICEFKALKVNLEWAKLFPVNDKGFYNLAALVKNPNFEYSVRLDYWMRYSNIDNVMIGEKRGSVKLAPLEEYLIFYPSLNYKNQKMNRVFFEKTKVHDLERAHEPEKKIIVNSKEIIRKGDVFKVKVVLENTDYKPHHEIQVFAILLDEKGEVINVSRSYLEYIDAGQKKEVYLY